MSLFGELTKDAFLLVNEGLLASLEGDAYQAILLTELITLSNAFASSDQMKNNYNWFFRSVKDVERDTGINDHRQRVAFTSLVEKGVIEIKLAGRPAKRFFRIIPSGVRELLGRDEPLPEPEELSKKQKQDLFYKNLNESIEIGFSSFKNSIGNIKKPFAAFMYTWSLLYEKRFRTNWVWNPENFGKLSIHWGKRKEKDFDYSSLAQFFFSIVDQGNEIPKWFEYSKNVFEKAPSEKVIDPSQYWDRKD